MHFRATTYKSGGVDARARVAYITRQTDKELDRADQQLRYIGVSEGDRQREDLIWTTSHNLPDWAHGKPHTFFAAAERYEGKNRAAFVEWKISLPRELTHRQNLELTRDLLHTTFGTQHPFTAAFHDPPAADGETQPHLHVIWSARTLDGINRPEAQFFKRWNAKHPERGGAQKDPMFSHMGAVFASRQLLTDVINLHLERHGQTARLDPRSLDDRGFDRAPEPKLRPSDSYALKSRYEVTPTMYEVLHQRHQREANRDAEQVQARSAWDSRKMTLGITPDMDLSQTLERVREAREHTVHQKPARAVSPVEHTLTAEIDRLETYHKQLTREITTERLFLQRGQPRSLAGRQHVEQLLAEGKAHGIPEPGHHRQSQRTQSFAHADANASAKFMKRPGRSLLQQLGSVGQEQEEMEGEGLRVKIFMQEEERDRGISW